MKVNIKKMIEKIMQDYQPINYHTWILGDRARQGINIKRLGILTPDELRVFNASIPYQDARNDPGHAELTAYFAKILFPFYLKAIEEIAVPVAIVHDNGWYGGDPNTWNIMVQEAQKVGNLSSLDSPEKRKEHQDKGAEIALELFKQAGYPSEKYYQECADIIADHDTRLKPTTPSGKLVRDSDYLWRVTLPCNKIYLFDDGIKNPEEVLKRAEDCCLNTKPPKKLEAVAYQIARIELANTIFFKFPNQAEKVLKPKYEKEFKKVRELYKK